LFNNLIGKSDENRILLCEHAAKLGCLPAMLAIGKYFHVKTNIHHHFELAVYWFLRAAELGYKKQCIIMHYKQINMSTKLEGNCIVRIIIIIKLIITL
jgi:TPR repeat protein